MLPPGIFSQITAAAESTALAGAKGIAAESTALLGAESTALLGTEAAGAAVAARDTPQGTHQAAQPMPSTTHTHEQHDPWRKLSAYATYAYA